MLPGVYCYSYGDYCRWCIFPHNHCSYRGPLSCSKVASQLCICRDNVPCDGCLYFHVVYFRISLNISVSRNIGILYTYFIHHDSIHNSYRLLLLQDIRGRAASPQPDPYPDGRIGRTRNFPKYTPFQKNTVCSILPVCVIHHSIHTIRRCDAPPRNKRSFYVVSERMDSIDFSYVHKLCIKSTNLLLETKGVTNCDERNVSVFFL